MQNSNYTFTDEFTRVFYEIGSLGRGFIQIRRDGKNYSHNAVEITSYIENRGLLEMVYPGVVTVLNMVEEYYKEGRFFLRTDSYFWISPKGTIY